MGEKNERKALTKEELMAYEPRIKEIGKAVLDLAKDIGVSIYIHSVNFSDDPDFANVGFSFLTRDGCARYEDIAEIWLEKDRGWFFDYKEDEDGK